MLYKAEVLNEAALRHARYYLIKLTKLNEAYQSTPESAVPSLRKIMQQLQQAHSWLVTNRDVDPSHVDMLVQLTAAGMGYIRMVVSPTEWDRWLQVGIEAAVEIERSVEHLDFIIEQGIHAFRQGDLESAQARAKSGEAAATTLDETDKRAQCYYLQALIYQKRGEPEAAHHAITQARQDYEQASDQAGIGKVRSFLAQAAIDALDYERAQELLEQNIQLWDQLGDLRQMAVEQYQLGVLLSNRVMYEKSDLYLHAACQSFRKLADRRYEAYSLQILSANAMERSSLAEALAYIEQAYGLFLVVNDQRGVAGALNYMGRIYNKQGNCERAIEAHQRAADVAQAIDYRFALTDAHRSMCVIHLEKGNWLAARQHIYEAVLVGETSGNRLLILAVLAAAVGVLAADDRLLIAADVAATIQTTTDETLILQMLEPHLAIVNVAEGTPMSVAEASGLVKKLYR